MEKNDNVKWVWVIIGIVLILFLFGNIGFGMMGYYGGFGPNSMMQMMYGFNNLGYGFMSMFGLIYMIAITVLIILGIYWLITKITESEKKRK